MASSDLYGACVSFLAGDSGDVRTKINLEQPGKMAAGSVRVTRRPRGEAARQRNALSLVVELVRATAPPDRVVGIGWVERDVAFDMIVTLRMKDTDGANQAIDLDEVTRALMARYEGVSNLAITVSSPMGNSATFVGSSAEVTSVEEPNESSEIARAVVRAVFTFTDLQADNT